MLDTNRSFVLSRPHVFAVGRLKPFDKERRNKCIIIIMFQCLKQPKSNISNLYISYPI
jgi:hypothetical protein